MELSLYDLYQKMLTLMGPTHWWPADSKQQIIIEAILIQNTTEANATRASKLIFEETAYDFVKIAELPTEKLEELVRPAGFMKNKSKAIQTLADWYLSHNQNSQAIHRKYGKDLRKRLLSLHGVGPETADVLLVYVFDQAHFVSDKYARTLFSHLGQQGFADYKSLAKELNTLPEPFSYQDAQEFHGLIDEFGKEYFQRNPTFDQSFLAGDKLIL